ncbi:MAG: hypothetical protein IPM64_11350 [Phycisphaerales bacterium]|nr:hypothetical protein [Phycisphaerales bacterium]
MRTTTHLWESYFFDPWRQPVHIISVEIEPGVWFCRLASAGQDLVHGTPDDIEASATFRLGNRP